MSGHAATGECVRATTRHGHVCTLCVYHEGGEGEAKMRGRRQRIFRWLTVQFSWSQSNLTCRCSTWNRRGDRERAGEKRTEMERKSERREGERESVPVSHSVAIVPFPYDHSPLPPLMSSRFETSFSRAGRDFNE